MPVVGAMAIAMLAAACGGDGDDATPPAVTTATSARPLATATSGAAAQTPAPANGIVEVTGIVGTVSAASRAIEINRLSGASVNRIEVGPATTIRTATGDRIALSDISPSERIIARGEINERGDAIVATEVTVQNVVPGGPGGAPGG